MIIGLFSAQSYADVQKSNATVQPCNSKIPTEKAINQSQYVLIGGIKQWITIKGKNCLNPIVLIVHGGPGNPLSLYHDSLHKDWENEFTIVHWDQRGSGKTYQANQETGELTLEQLEKEKLNIELLVSDGHEITDYISNTLRQDKIIITGSSWGSSLALKMAYMAPDKYQFYVGLSQLVNYQKNMKESYDLVKTLAVKKQDMTALDTLSKIGSPPWYNPRSFGKLRRIIRAYESEVVEAPAVLKIGKEYNTDKVRAAYFSGEEFSFVKFVGLDNNGMAQKIALDECCTQLKIPIYIIQGENDLLTTAKVTESFFDKIKAPSKKYFLIKHSAHDPNIKMLEKQLSVLKTGMQAVGK